MEDSAVRRLHERIDHLARDVHTLELTTVKRDGPVVAELRSTTRAVDRMNDKLLTREEFRRAMEADDYRTFNRHDKIVGSTVAILVLLLQAVDLIVFLTR